VAYALGVGLALRALGRIAQAEDQLAEARTLLTGSLEALASTEARFEMARTRLELAELSHREGDRDAAARQGRLAEEVFTASGVSRYEERTRDLAFSRRPERLG
jgi:hypothetical protein